MSVTLSRHAVLEAISIAVATGVDAQGLPSYGSPVAVQARVVREENDIVQGNGDTIKTLVTVWIPADQVAFPSVNDKVTCADGFVGIAVDRYDGKTLQDVLDHVKVHLRRV